MYAVGVIEIAAGVVVAFAPALRGPAGRGLARRDHLQPAHLSGYYDIALRDFGLLVGALALWRLSVEYARE